MASYYIVPAYIIFRDTFTREGFVLGYPGAAVYSLASIRLGEFEKWYSAIMELVEWHGCSIVGELSTSYFLSTLLDFISFLSHWRCALDGVGKHSFNSASFILGGIWAFINFKTVEYR